MVYMGISEAEVRVDTYLYKLHKIHFLTCTPDNESSNNLPEVLLK